MAEALVIGAGPAGLMAAEVLSAAGFAVTLAEAMPSPGRKLLMAGKSGLNLTKEEPEAAFRGTFDQIPALQAALEAFGPGEAMAWARGLGQEVFAGGRFGGIVALHGIIFSDDFESGDVDMWSSSSAR